MNSSEFLKCLPSNVSSLRKHVHLLDLDMIKHKLGRSEISREEFDFRLRERVNLSDWIIDGNYQRTLDIRIRDADKYAQYYRTSCLGENI